MSKRVFVTCLSNEPYLNGEGLRTSGRLNNLTLGKMYEAVQEDGWWRVWDDFGDDYLYPATMFKLTT